MLDEKLEKTNEAYALAKISGIKLSEYLFSQHKLDIICLMPTNLYGINDKLIIFKSCYSRNDCKIMKQKQKNVELFGSGKPLREFMFNDDLSVAILLFKNVKKKYLMYPKILFQYLILEHKKNISIKKLAHLISREWL